MTDWGRRLETSRGHRSCRLTTRGRRTGRAHSVTVWFAASSDEIYLGTLRLERDWPKNLAKNPEVEIQIGDLRLHGVARAIDDETRRRQIEELLRQKYWVSRIGAWLGLRPQGVFVVRITGEAS